MTDLSVDAPLLSGRSPGLGIDAKVAAVAVALLLGGAAMLTFAISWRQGALYLLGGALGLTLYHALFGFTSAWRVFISDRRGTGLRAQMIMLAVPLALFFPAPAHGTLFGHPAHGEYGAVGGRTIFRAFAFRLGRHLRWRSASCTP